MCLKIVVYFEFILSPSEFDSQVDWTKIQGMLRLLRK
jgi:hypothetical protein